MHPAPPRQCGVPKLAGSPTLPLPKLRTASRTCSQCSKKFVAPTGKSKTLFHGHTLFCTARCHTAWANAHNVEGVVKTVRRKSPPLAAASSSAAAHTAYLALSAELARSRDRAVEIAKAHNFSVSLAASAELLPLHGSAAPPRAPARSISIGVRDGQTDIAGAVRQIFLVALGRPARIGAILEAAAQKRRSAAAAAAAALGEGLASQVADMTIEDVQQLMAVCEARVLRAEAAKRAVKAPVGALDALRARAPALFDPKDHIRLLDRLNRVEIPGGLKALSGSVDELTALRDSAVELEGKLDDGASHLLKRVRGGKRGVAERLALLRTWLVHARDLLGGLPRELKLFEKRFEEAKLWDERPLPGAGGRRGILKQDAIVESFLLEEEVAARSAQLAKAVAELKEGRKLWKSAATKPRASGDGGGGSGGKGGELRRILSPFFPVNPGRAPARACRPRARANRVTREFCASGGLAGALAPPAAQ